MTYVKISCCLKREECTSNVKPQTSNRKRHEDNEDNEDNKERGGKKQR